MKIKAILLMILTLVSVFAAIWISTIYSGFVAPYLIGLITPIIADAMYTIDFKNNKKEK